MTAVRARMTNAVTSRIARVVERFGRRRVVITAIVAAVVVIGGVTVGLVLTSGEDSYTITAQFQETPGLYPHNRVDILGVGVGEVRSLTPGQGYVTVKLSIPKRVKLPAGVQAVLMAPNPVSDRTVELTPPYQSGPTLKAGGTIPLSRTLVPLELDQVYASVDALSQALGPAGANKNGELSSALHALAELADGNGQDAHQALTAIAAALPALTEHPDQLKQLIDGIDQLTNTLASRNSTINSLYDNLTSVTGELADERNTLASAIANLQSGLAQVATFIKDNQANLGASVHNLASVVQSVMKEQQALITTFNTAPLGFQNFNHAIDKNAACPSASGTCPALFGRLNLTSDAAQIVTTYCGSSILTSLLPILAYTAKLPGGTPVDTLCAAEIGLLQGQPGPPNAPKSPDLDLSHYLGSK
jgi:phospholipid/cholesterol/gamma-HCH transport system substrate-binding protein